MDYKTIKPYLIECLYLTILYTCIRLFNSYLGIGKSTWKDIFTWEYLAGVVGAYVIFAVIRYLLRYLYRAYIHRN